MTRVSLFMFHRDGNLPDIIASSSLHEFLVNLHEKYGPLVSFWFGRRLVVSLGSIDLLKQHANPNRLCKGPFVPSGLSGYRVTKEAEVSFSVERK